MQTFMFKLSSAGWAIYMSWSKCVCVCVCVWMLTKVPQIVTLYAKTC